MEHASAPTETMTGPSGASAARQWLAVATATTLVAGGPVAAVWWLRESGTVSSALLAAMLGVLLSMLASFAGGAVWETLPGSEDLLFSELMLWGFLHRRYVQRRLTGDLDALQNPNAGAGLAFDGLNAHERAKLLRRLVTRMETRDPYLHGHSRRVARHAWMIAKRMGLPGEEVARIRTAAAIHDVGKIHTPIEILHKPGPLDDAEYEQIKLHPGDGASLVAALGDPELTAIVRHHHERLDGTGYPDRLAGDQIPLGARIVAVADTFDAITSIRPYRGASPHRTALVILRGEAGTRLDGAAVRAFCGHYAGRGPLALWSFVADLPERALEWVLGSAASVASAAKVAAVAALVGGAAIGSSGLGQELIRSVASGSGSSHAAARAHSASAAVGSASRATSQTTAPPILAAGGAATHHGHPGNGVTHGGAAATPQGSSAVSAAQTTGAAGTGVSGESAPGVGGGGGDPHHGSGEGVSGAGESGGGASSGGQGTAAGGGDTGEGVAKGKETTSGKGPSTEGSSGNGESGKGPSTEGSSGNGPSTEGSSGKGSGSTGPGKETAGAGKTEEAAGKSEAAAKAEAAGGSAHGASSGATAGKSTEP